MIAEIISRISNRTEEISDETFAAQLDAFLPKGEPDTLEFSSLVARNTGQVGRLIDDAKLRLEEVNRTIEAATYLRLEIQTSLKAWEAAAAVLMAPTTPLAAKIAEASSETAAAAGAVVKAAAKVKREASPVTRVAGGVEYKISDIAEYFGMNETEVIALSEDAFANAVVGWNKRPRVQDPA